jgi:hypothetical protein
MNQSTDKLNTGGPELKQMYFIWKGNSRFFCKGKLYAG